MKLTIGIKLMFMMIGLGMIQSEWLNSSNSKLIKVQPWQFDLNSSNNNLTWRLSCYKLGFRIQVTRDDQFSEPTEPIVIYQPEPEEPDKVVERENYWEFWMEEGGILMEVNKSPIKFIVYNRNGEKLIEEMNPIHLDEEGTYQTISINSDENFVGGGMQNGRFNHRNKSIDISVDYNWEDGGHPNPVPFYMSSRGYGVFRNTFSPGTYHFQSGKFHHKESRFDGYYFLDDIGGIINKFTKLTGRPFMPPIYGLRLGDADCYLNTANGRPKRHTLPDTKNVSLGYVDHDLPVGWMLVNDGYGCGYEQLPETRSSLKEHDIQLGLWTEEDLTNQPYEIQSGVRVRKLDVKWVGEGYEFAFRACHDAYNGIQKYSDARGFVWLVEGWAGVQRCGVQWTGDQSGSFKNIQFHIPTLFGAGLSGQTYVASDIDGIFGGTPESYIRDLQFKMFTPMTMVMSGWSKFDKQPWRFGEPGTTINRIYLKLRERLLPYIYSLAWESHTTGLPIMRANLLEFPNDPNSWDPDIINYQYLFGPSFLVAPIYTNTTIRNNIYLPSSLWYDYWSHDTFNGPFTLNNYHAPLSKLPLFVREGSIIPMSPPNLPSHSHSPTLYLDLYPSHRHPTNFSLYEDDGQTRAFESGIYTTQLFSLQPITLLTSQLHRQIINFTIHPIHGSYPHRSPFRSYRIQLHTSSTKSTKPTVTISNYPTTTTTRRYNYHHHHSPQLPPYRWSYSLTDQLIKISIDHLPLRTGLTVTIDL